MGRRAQVHPILVSDINSLFCRCSSTCSLIWNPVSSLHPRFLFGSRNARHCISSGISWSLDGTDSPFQLSLNMWKTTSSLSTATIPADFQLLCEIVYQKAVKRRLLSQVPKSLLETNCSHTYFITCLQLENEKKQLFAFFFLLFFFFPFTYTFPGYCLVLKQHRITLDV